MKTALPTRNTTASGTARRPASRKSATKKTAARKTATRTPPPRRAVVFVSLMGVLGLTGVLLRAMATSPMTPDASASLFVTGGGSSLEQIFDTQVQAPLDRWRYIYVHHSLTPSGNATTLGQSSNGMPDHFVIGNGDGCGDGEVQIGQRWMRQVAAGSPMGFNVDPSCISVCLIGNFDQAAPTGTQYQRLSQLVQALQAHYHIPAENVRWFTNLSGNPAGIGSAFPASSLRNELLSWQTR